MRFTYQLILKYQEIAIRAGAKCPDLRKSSLSGDKVKTVDVAIDLIENLEEKYQYFYCSLQHPLENLKT